MKKGFLLFVLSFLVLFAKAQNVSVSIQTSCQPVGLYFYADAPGSCGTTYYSTSIYYPSVGNNVYSMFPGGGGLPISWNTPPPAGSQFTAVKIFDPGFAWGNAVFNPCLGPQTFPPQGACGIQASSNWSSPSLVGIKVFQ